MILTGLLYVAILPLAIAVIAALLARPLRVPPTVTWAACVALAYVAGQLALASRAGDAFSMLLHPREAADWLPHAVLCALAITILATRLPRPWHRVAIALAITLSIGLPLRVLSGSAYDLHWTLIEKSAYIALLSATLALTWLILASAPSRTTHNFVPCC